MSGSVRSRIHTLTQNGNIPLGIASENGHAETVQRLLEEGAMTNYQKEVCLSVKYHQKFFLISNLPA